MSALGKAFPESYPKSASAHKGGAVRLGTIVQIQQSEVKRARLDRETISTQSAEATERQVVLLLSMGPRYGSTDAPPGFRRKRQALRCSSHTSGPFPSNSAGLSPFSCRSATRYRPPLNREQSRARSRLTIVDEIPGLHRIVKLEQRIRARPALASGQSKLWESVPRRLSFREPEAAQQIVERHGGDRPRRSPTPVCHPCRGRTGLVAMAPTPGAVRGQPWAERSPRTRRCHALASAAFQVVGLTHTELMKN
jgi:hypothetical protein